MLICSFLENKAPELEVRKLPATIDRDELEFEGPIAPVCYYIVGGNEKHLFKLNPMTHELMVRFYLYNKQIFMKFITFYQIDLIITILVLPVFYSYCLLI